MKAQQLALQLDAPARTATLSQPIQLKHPPIVPIAGGEKAKAQDILAAIRTLKKIERLRSQPDDDEATTLARFPGFGPVALSIFPDPVSGKFKDGWQAIGRELRELLTPEEYESAKRTTFCQFFTSPVVMQAMHEALHRLGVPKDALVLEAGCGSGNFMAHAPDGYQFIGVELDSLSGRIAKARFPHHQIRIENFKNSVLPKFDAAIGNVPFADIKLDHNGQRFSLHDYFLVKSVDQLAPGGILAVVTSHYSLDRQNAAAREYLAGRADFLGAIRLPSTAFKQEGTAVVTDIVFLRKRAPGREPHHADPEWLTTAPMDIGGAEVAVNKYYLSHPEMVLGDWSRKDTLYGEGYSVAANGDLAGQLKEAIARLTPGVTPESIRQVTQTEAERPNPPPFTPPPLQPHIGEGSFFIDGHRVIRQIADGKAEPVVYGGKTLTASGGMTGQRLAALVALRDKARRVLQSQSVDAAYAAKNAVAAITDYGTSRINGITLFEQALNMKTPTIYDPDPDDPDKKIVNQEETLAAREKQKLIKERFKSWIFSDPDRAERLVRMYNDTYNNLRPRLFDGSHLEFPGMSGAFTLRQHQKDAVWRGMSSGNTLLAHCVGAGKSALMATTGMKMKQAGLIKKPLYVVPNHLLEQFAREFLHVYPNTRVLVAAKEDFTRERRKFLTAKIASGDWDAIITTHSSFERIGMSRNYQEQFLNEQIREYEDLIIEHAAGKGDNRNIIKHLEKQKAAREQKLQDLMAEEKKDDGLTFDQLGVDHIFIDELQYFKNLETPTKMDRVAGIQTGGSERAFDLFMKCRYLDQLHPGHGITGATGTPVSNSMVEMYTMSRYLDPAGLKSRELDHFDAWAATFGEVVEAMEISPDGKTLKPRSRFAKFVNLPELLMMFRSFADVKTPDDLKLPCPNLKGGKPQTIACPMSEQQKELQDELVERYETIRSTKVDPRVDNALKITTDGRKLALDGRMLSPGAEDFPGSKINALVENVASIWRDTADKRSAQMIFCDMGVNPTPWGYSAYDDVITKLVKAGIPRQEIASIGDADTDAKKRVLFEKVRNGQVRVLIGSTTKMGTGTNVQKRLIALHHLDAPWKPAEVEQREGRILRQGNENKEVQIFRYVTEGSFDSYMWQTLETKARFINQIMSGKSGIRQADDIGNQELSYAEVKAIASGNPAVLVLAETDAEVQKLSVLRKSHGDEQFIINRRLKSLPDHIKHLHKRSDGLKKDIATLKAHPDHAVTLGGRTLSGDEAVIALSDRLDTLPLSVSESRYIDLGTYRGLRFGVVLHPLGGSEIYLQGDAVRRADIRRDARGLAVLNALNRLARGYEEAEESTRQELALAESQQRDFQSRLGAADPHEAYLKELSALREQLRMALSGAEAKEGKSAAEIAGRIKALRSQNSVEPAPEREARTIAAEEPVTTRIRRRAEERAGEEAQEAPADGKWRHILAQQARANAERIAQPG